MDIATLGVCLNKIKSINSEITDKLEVKTLSTNIEAGTDVTINQIQEYRIGDIILVTGTFTTAEQKTSSSNILKKLEKPTMLTNVILFATDGSNKCYPANIRTTGDLRFGITTPAGEYIFNCSYYSPITPVI